MPPRLDLEEVRAALLADVPGVLAALGWATKREGSQLVSKACPARADHSRASWKISPITGLWRCMSCITSGDMFDVVAEVEGLDVGRDFPAVLARAAALVGVTPSDASAEEREARRRELAARRETAAAAAREERAELERRAIPTASAYWAACAPADARGLAYLASRGLGAAARLCRFDLRAGGSPAVALHTRDGQIRNVVRRLTPAALAALPEDRRDRKTPGLYRCPTAGTLLGSLRDIAPGRNVVVPEGVADTLTAALLWPGAVILGAHGADNLPAIVRAAARCCRIVRAPLLVPPHNDATGQRVLRAGVELARAEGVEVVVVNQPEKDLNDAWRAGWRPT